MTRLANMQIPVLMITYNRLEYTKEALDALVKSDCGKIFVVDNCSTDGTIEYLWNYRGIKLFSNRTNMGIADAMNKFLKYTALYKYVGKVDNDTIVPADWCSRLYEKMKKCNLDIIQAKHPILSTTHENCDFDDWCKIKMKQDPKDPSIYYNHFVGGSGILFKRKIVDRIPETEWKLGGWRQFQREHPELRKAFTTDVEIELLDMNKTGGADYSAYPEYYKETGRL